MQATALSGAASAVELSRPAWAPIAVSAPTHLPPLQGNPGKGKVLVYVENVGGLSSSGSVVMEDELPPGLAVDTAPTGTGWTCGGSGDSHVACSTTSAIAPGAVSGPIVIPVAVNTPISGVLENSISVSGGGASPTAYKQSIEVDPQPAPPGIAAFMASFRGADGSASVQAASHPTLGTFAVLLNTVTSEFGLVAPAGSTRTLSISLPPGFLVNPAAISRCTKVAQISECPREAQVGTASPLGLLEDTPSNSALYAIGDPFGFPGELAFNASLYGRVGLFASLRSDGDYGTTVKLSDIAADTAIFGAFFSLWGTPADAIHDSLRCGQSGPCGPSSAPPSSLFSMPANCAAWAQPPQVSLRVDTWQTAGESDDTSISLPALSGCDQLASAPVGVELLDPDTVVDSPAALAARLHASTEGLTDPTSLGPAEIRSAVVRLPEGVVINPPFADGLTACSEAQIGLRNEIDSATGLPVPMAMPSPIRFDQTPSRCPDAAKIGMVKLRTPLLERPLEGGLYLAASGNGNPFGSLIALYMVVEDARAGVEIKLPAKVTLDPSSGRLGVVIEDLPQLPIETLELSFNGGPRAPLATPQVCGSYPAESRTTPWSAPESGPSTQSTDRLAIDAAPGGAACARTATDRPFALGLRAGAVMATAGAPSPFNLRVTRPDGSQELVSLDLTLPAGVSPDLRGIPLCEGGAIEAARGRGAAAEEASPSCPAASQVGTSLTGAGSGSSPFYLPGRLYLAGPYKGAPFSLVSITPAAAGPFDLGNLVLRTTLEVDPLTAQITARTDPLPRFLKGVALRLRDLRLSFDRPGWIRNPTSCEPTAVRVVAHGDSGALADLSSRFQVGGCRALAFKPRLRLHLRGAPSRNGHPALTVTLGQAVGQASAASLTFLLPRGELLAQDHIRDVCSGARFDVDACPVDSVYGHAEVVTPLTDGPLRGPVYLRASSHKLPDLVLALRGPRSQPVAIDVVGHLDAAHGRIRVRFDSLPDAPISKLTLRMAGGRRGLLVNSRGLCGTGAHAVVRILAHNDKRADRFPRLDAGCGRRGPH